MSCQDSSPLVEVKGLTASVPGGQVVLESTDLRIVPGEVVSILGPSGAGKTTLLRAVFTPEVLARSGFGVTAEQRNLRTTPAFVPQRGALLDYLDVGANIRLAQASAALPQDAASWLRAVELDDSEAFQSRPVASLSGGQAQRVALARALAAGRCLLVLDEPSVGLDPLAVRQLAQLLVKQARAQGTAILIATHDLPLAAGVSDQVLFLDPRTRHLSPALPEWRGPAELEEPAERLERIASLEGRIESLLGQERPRPAGSGKMRRRLRGPALQGPLLAAGTALLSLIRPRMRRESTVVLAKALMQSLVQPFLFFTIVGLLLGYTVPYVIAHISEVLRPAATLSLIGGSYIIALAPPLSAIIFASTSGSAINAWLGGLRLNQQVLALEGLGVDPDRYLWSPSWFALVLAYLFTAVVFASAMILGGWVLFEMTEVANALDKLTADFIAPAPERVRYLVRAVWSVVVYALALASIAVFKGSEGKDRSEQVTSAMTSGVVQATLFVVAAELASVALLFALTEGG